MMNSFPGSIEDYVVMARVPDWDVRGDWNITGADGIFREFSFKRLSFSRVRYKHKTNNMDSCAILPRFQALVCKLGGMEHFSELE